MIENIRVYESTVFNPYINIATEKYLMDTTPVNGCTLYLWQNQNTVVIGHNQNPWVECRTSLLEEEGGTLARRLSGGGAVFHDLGNLNFTFTVARENYDLSRQLEVIRKACEFAGIKAEKSGRNDILAQGRKFSGNAFYQNQTHAYHHGTLLVDVDMDKLQRYLSPSKAKLEAKGVSSVRSRVVNLKELAPSLTIDRMKEFMLTAFNEVYGLKATAAELDAKDLQTIHKLADDYSRWDYIYGTPLPFTIQAESHFSWGAFQLQLEVKSGTVQSCKVYSDSMDWQLPSQIEALLTGVQFQQAAFEAALREVPFDRQIADDLIALAQEQLLHI